MSKSQLHKPKAPARTINMSDPDYQPSKTDKEQLVVHAQSHGD